MRFGQNSKRNGAHRLFTPFLNSPALLTLYLIALLACVVLLEIVLLKAGKALPNKDLQHRSIHNEFRSIALWNKVLETRQDDSGDDSADDGGDTSDDTGTDTSDSDTSNDDDTSGGNDDSGADDNTSNGDDTGAGDNGGDNQDDQNGQDDPVDDNPADDPVDDPADDQDDTTDNNTDTNTNNESDPDTENGDDPVDDSPNSTNETSTDTSTDTSTTIDSDPPISATNSTTNASNTTSTGEPSNEDDSDDDEVVDDEDSSSTLGSNTTATGMVYTSAGNGLSSLFKEQHKVLALPPSVQTMPVKVNTLVKFTATYAAIIIAVAFKTCWLIIFASLKLNEPFYQLTRPGGPSNPETGMMFEFLATGFPIDHFKAGFLGNWTSWYMMTSYAVLLLLLFVPSLAAEAFSIQNVKGQCLDTTSTTGHCARRVWTVATKPVRTLQIAFIVLAVLVFIILIIRLRRSSYYRINNISLGTVADTLRDPATLTVLRRVPLNASHAEMDRILNEYQYRLDSNQGDNGTKDNPSYTLRATPSNRATNPESPAYLAMSRFFSRMGPWLPTLDLALPMGIAMFMLSIIASYASGRINNSSLTAFFTSPRFGPKFFLTAVTTLLGIAFCRVEYEVRILTTYRSLFTASDPTKSLERSLHGSPYTQTFASLFRVNEWVCALISGMAGPGILVLSIVIGNVPWHSGQSPQSAKACIITSVTLLMLMIISLLIVAFWRRQNARLREFEKLPGTLAEICVLMAHGCVPGVNMNGEDGKQLLEENNENAEEKKGAYTVTVREY